MELDKCDLDVIEHAHPRVEWGIRPEIKWCLHWMRTMPPSSSIRDQVVPALDADDAPKFVHLRPDQYVHGITDARSPGGPPMTLDKCDWDAAWVEYDTSGDYKLLEFKWLMNIIQSSKGDSPNLDSAMTWSGLLWSKIEEGRR